VIRDLLETDTLCRPPELALLDAIHKVVEKTDVKAFTADEAVRMSGLDREQIGELSQAGIISAAKKKRREAPMKQNYRMTLQ
jgi:hypothetical protein